MVAAQSEDRRERIPVLLLVIAVVSISSSAILIRLTSTPPLAIAFFRQLTCAVLVFPYAQRESWPHFNWRDRGLLALSGLFLALHFATWITGLHYTTIARATLLVDLQPVWASILAAIFLHERLAPAEIFGVIAVTVGGMITVVGVLDGEDASIYGDLLALAGGIAGACYLLIGRGVRNRIRWIQYMFAVFAISSFWLLLFHWILLRSLPALFERDFFYILLMAIGPGILGHGLLNLSLHHFKTYAVNAAFLGEPVLATLLAYLIFAEHPDAFFFAGGAIVLAGLWLIFRVKR